MYIFSLYLFIFVLFIIKNIFTSFVYNIILWKILLKYFINIAAKDIFQTVNQFIWEGEVGTSDTFYERKDLHSFTQGEPQFAKRFICLTYKNNIQF